ncbi:Nicotianamine synthase [Bisporella sp. PMI_857]|nr:Nicotianamine synthase [Bisporella sp. PMI_857]
MGVTSSKILPTRIFRCMGRISPPAPTPSDRAEEIIQTIVVIHDRLATRQDLYPCAEVNKLFGDLVALCIQTLPKDTAKEILLDPRIVALSASLQCLCGTAECNLEAHWARFISYGGDIKEVEHRLDAFPYYQNYIDLTRLELSAIEAVHPNPLNRIAFLGSGPLPLTSFCLYSNSSKPNILNIDRDPSSISQSSLLSQKLGFNEKRMMFSCEDVAALETDLSGFDVVYLAALVGGQQTEKERHITAVVKRMKQGALLIIRSAHSLRKLLYPEFNPTTEAVLQTLEICMVVHPHNHIVNSVIVAKVR